MHCYCALPASLGCPVASEGLLPSWDRSEQYGRPQSPGPTSAGQGADAWTQPVRLPGQRCAGIVKPHGPFWSLPQHLAVDGHTPGGVTAAVQTHVPSCCVLSARSLAVSPLGSWTGMGLPGESSGHPWAVGLVLRVEFPSEVSQQACFLQNT